MGLLDFLSTPDGQLGLGLLGAAGPRFDGAGFGQRLQEGMGYAQAQKDAEMRKKQAQAAMEMQAMQMQEARAKMVQDAEIRALLPRFKIPARQNISPIGEDVAAAAGIAPSAVTSTPSGFDRQGYGNALEAINPMQGLAYQQAIQKDNTPITVAPGASLVDKHTFKPVYTAPKEHTDPAAIQEWQLAKSQGDTRNFTDWSLAMKKAGAVNVNNTLSMAGPKAFEQELGKLDAKQLEEWRTSAGLAQNTIGLIKNMRSAEDQGAYSGGAANLRMGAANLINGFTGATPKGFVGSQLYNAEASKLVLDKIKLLGANPSNADRDFIEKTVPQLSTSAQARQQMQDFLEQKALQAISLYKRADKHARKNSGLNGFDIFDGQSGTDDLVRKYTGGN